MRKGNVTLKRVALGLLVDTCISGHTREQENGKYLEVSLLCFRIPSNLDKEARLKLNYNHYPNPPA